MRDRTAVEGVSRRAFYHSRVGGEGKRGVLVRWWYDGGGGWGVGMKGMEVWSTSEKDNGAGAGVFHGVEKARDVEG